MEKIGLSVIIPIYNSEQWILPTLEKLDKALLVAPFDAEIIVVDDGSTDKSVTNARKVHLNSGATFNIISQSNKGRYLARKSGIAEASKENILLLDSRVFVGEQSLSYLANQLSDNPDQIWNGHVNIDKLGNMYARFWDAIVLIAWRRYFRHPRPVEYGIKDFDHFPKGTGFFYAPKARLVAAMKHFEATTNDVKHSSDDTLLIRFMNRRQNIHLSPQFNCLYHGRTSAKGFFIHAYHRGEFFIDGFLRPGTRFFVPLLLVLTGSILLLVMLCFMPVITLQIIVTGICLFVVGLFVVALLLGLSLADASSLAILGAPFSGVYLAGLWRGTIRRLVNK